MVISFYYVFISNMFFTRQFVVLILLLFWSNRLTFNWLRKWRGLSHEDWRYSNLRKKHGKRFWFINLTGIQLLPTILVYLGSLSLYPILSINTNINFIDIIAFIITAGAITIETIADEQMYKFTQKRENSGQIINVGLWKHSRHPNYLGEILFWVGLYFFALATDLVVSWWMIIGPISMILLFNIVSIPLMEKRNLERKSEYQHYIETTSRLIPWFSKKKED
jgi:steroid 5-alpha reductase family enzyme